MKRRRSSEDLRSFIQIREECLTEQRGLVAVLTVVRGIVIACVGCGTMLPRYEV